MRYILLGQGRTNWYEKMSSHTGTIVASVHCLCKFISIDGLLSLICTICSHTALRSPFFFFFFLPSVCVWGLSQDPSLRPSQLLKAKCPTKVREHVSSQRRSLSGKFSLGVFANEEPWFLATVQEDHGQQVLTFNPQFLPRS